MTGPEVPDVPVYAADLFSDEALTDPYPHYRAMRQAGPVLWLGALVRRVARIQLAGPPERKLNNLIR